jgi:hypothetical protein
MQSWLIWAKRNPAARRFPQTSCLNDALHGSGEIVFTAWNIPLIYAFNAMHDIHELR